ncbi:MAG: aspartate aminotransferase [Deltaproteobacteria bacterium]|nr:aspartate aminotransferase [Deltaproteobacteria bacterium]
MINSYQTSHLDSIGSFLAMDIFSLAQKLEAQGREIIHLEFGEPDFSPPPEAAKSVRECIETQPARYTHTQGIEQLRINITKKYSENYGVQIEPQQVLVSNGSSLLLFLSVLLLAKPGTEVILTDPSFACYENTIRIAGAKPILIKLHKEEGFQLNLDELRKKITSKTSAILINSPSNPTGVVFNPEVMKGLAGLGIPVISDEIYADLSYEESPYSFLSFSDNTIAIHGFSKYYAMTGWRLGFMITPIEWMSSAARLHQNLMISANDFVQQAGIAVLQNSTSYCESMKFEFNKRRKYVLNRLSELGMNLGYTPTGAFYVLYKYRDSSKSSFNLCKEVLEKTGVAIAPGRDFGLGAEGYIRISYANSMENIEKALTKIAETGLL